MSFILPFFQISTPWLFLPFLLVRDRQEKQTCRKLEASEKEEQGLYSKLPLC
jgi:hypothetical protein